MMLYRVDKREFKIGDVISPSPTFEKGLDEMRKAVENMLNHERPKGIPQRGDCLFLFQDLICALRFFYKYGGTIYGVNTEQCFYKGDMNILDNILDIFRITCDETLRTHAVKRYWESGSHTFNPCYEILTNSAIVEKVILTSCSLKDVQNEINYFGKDIEHTSIYKNLLKEV